MDGVKVNKLALALAARDTAGLGTALANRDEVAIALELALRTLEEALAVDVASGTVEGRTVLGVGDAPAVYKAIVDGVGIVGNSASTEAGKALAATRGCC